ncbi:MAG: TRAP transporter substrate-binding protein [Pseudomonadota bacterium]
MKLKLGLLAALLLGTQAQAQTTISIGTWLSPAHPQNSVVLETWKTQLEEASDGRLTAKLEYHNGHPKAIFDQVEDGTYDVGWSFHGYVPGRFRLTELAELPGANAGAGAASVAYWRTHEQYLADAGEHEGLKLIALFTHGPGQIHMTNPIESLADMKGKKIRVGGGIQSVLAERMGITPVPAPGSKVYEILQQGVADGVFMPAGEQATLRLSEVAPNLYLFPGGMYLGSFGIFMNEDFFADLSAEDQDALMSVSGEALSKLAGSVWEANDKAGLKQAREAGNNVVDMGQADIDALADLTADLDDSFKAKVADSGVDLDAAISFYRDTAQSLEN